MFDHGINLIAKMSLRFFFLFLNNKIYWWMERSTNNTLPTTRRKYKGYSFYFFGR